MSERILRSRTRKSLSVLGPMEKKMSSAPRSRQKKEEVQNILNTLTQDRKERQRSRRKRVVFSAKKYTSDDVANGDAELRSFDTREGVQLVGILKLSSPTSDSPSTPVTSDEIRKARTLNSRGSTGSPLLSALALAFTPVSPEQKRVAHEVEEEDDEVRRSVEFYRDSGEWWNVFPKTDYTYSEFSSHRREVSPGVMAVPNMSRVGIGHVEGLPTGEDCVTSVYQRRYVSKSSRRLSYDSDSDTDEVDSPFTTQQRLSNQRHIAHDGLWRITLSALFNFASATILFLRRIPHRLLGNGTYTYDRARYTTRYQEKSISSKFYSFCERIWSNVCMLISSMVVSDPWVVSSRGSSSHHGLFKNRRFWLLLLGILLLFIPAWWIWRSNSSVPDPNEPSVPPMDLQDAQRWPWTWIQGIYEHCASLVAASVDTLRTLVWDVAGTPKRLLSFFFDLLSCVGGIFFSLLEMIIALFSIGKANHLDTTFSNDFEILQSTASKSDDLKAFIEEAVRQREAALLSEMNRRMAEREQALLLELAKKEEELYARVLKSSEHLSLNQHKQDDAERNLRFEFQNDLKDQEHTILKSIDSLNNKVNQDTAIIDQELKQSRDMIKRGAENMAQLAEEQSSLLLQLNTIQENIQEASIKEAGKHESWLQRANILTAKVSHLQSELQRVWRRMGACCGPSPTASTVSHIQSHVRSEVNRLLSSPEGASLLQTAIVKSSIVVKEPLETEIRAWISASFVGKDDFDQALANLTSHFYNELARRDSIMMSATSEDINARLSQSQYDIWDRMAGLRSSITAHQLYKHDRLTASVLSNDEAADTIDVARIRKIVNEALALYDADKTGMTDYALESQGGQVVSTRCSETYQVKSPTLSLFGVPLWYPSNSPRTVIQPGVRPGECWAFVGSQGFLVVQLSHRIKVRAFTYEHVSPLLLPTGKMDSAPREFSVYGLHSEVDMNPILLGNYVFLENGTSIQHFSVQNLNAEPMQLIEIQIKSNHGNINYTCLYRFRVHGVLVN